MDFQQHIYRLAADYDVAICEVYGMPPDQAKASPRARTIIIAPVTDETTYAVALHELGHVCAPVDERTCYLSKDAQDRASEAAAWKWARQRALVWTELMEKIATWAEATYAEDTVNPHTTPEDQEIIALLGQERYNRLQVVAMRLLQPNPSKTDLEAFKLIVYELPEDVRKTIVAKLKGMGAK